MAGRLPKSVTLFVAVMLPTGICMRSRTSSDEINGNLEEDRLSDNIEVGASTMSSQSMFETCHGDIGSKGERTYNWFLTKCSHNAQKLNDADVSAKVQAAKKIRMRGIIMETTINGATGVYNREKGGHVITQFVLDKKFTFNLGLTINTPEKPRKGPAGDGTQGAIIGTAWGGNFTTATGRVLFQDVTTAKMGRGLDLGSLFKVRYATPEVKLDGKNVELFKLVQYIRDNNAHYDYKPGLPGMSQGNCYTAAKTFMKIVGHRLKAEYQACPCEGFITQKRSPQLNKDKVAEPEWLIRSLTIT